MFKGEEEEGGQGAKGRGGGVSLCKLFSCVLPAVKCSLMRALGGLRSCVKITDFDNIPDFSFLFEWPVSTLRLIGGGSLPMSIQPQRNVQTSLWDMSCAAEGESNAVESIYWLPFLCLLCFAPFLSEISSFRENDAADKLSEDGLLRQQRGPNDGNNLQLLTVCVCVWVSVTKHCLCRKRIWFNEQVQTPGGLHSNLTSVHRCSLSSPAASLHVICVICYAICNQHVTDVFNWKLLYHRVHCMSVC